jgi:vacuolar-type H+-ATPase subunit I/STV1
VDGNASRTEAELLAQLDRLQCRREFLLSQRSEATRLIGEIDKEEQRVRNHLRSLEKNQRAAC